MSRKLTASDRKNLIRLASTLPKGSQERRAILANLSGAFYLDRDRYRSPFGIGKEIFESMLSQDTDKIWIKDNQGRLTEKEIGERALKGSLGSYLQNVADRFWEEGDSPEWIAEYEELVDEAEKIARKARFTVERVTSPRTGNQGYLITWVNKGPIPQAILDRAS